MVKLNKLAGLCLLVIALVWQAPARAAEPAQDFSFDQPFASEILTFLVEDEVLGHKTCRTMFIGSSSIRFWFTLAEDFPELPLVRRGFGGAHLEHVIAYFDLLVTPQKPKQIVVYAGENDISAGKSPGDVLADLQQLLAIKDDRLGTTPVWFIALKPSRLRAGEFERQSQANRLIMDLAAARDDLIFIDVVAPMMQDGAPKDIFIRDNLHMNLDGYAIWTRVVGAALAAGASTRAPHCP